MSITTTRDEYPSYDDDEYSSSESEELYHHLNDSSPPPSPSPPPPLEPAQERKHFCVICNKQFGSGKAYGGHVRIHSSEYFNNKGKFKKVKKIKKKKIKKKKGKRGLVNDKEREKEIDLIREDVDGKIRCCLCGKEFQTMHSLFGHMRRHPERSWKGVRPPPSTDSKMSFMDGEYEMMSRSMMVRSDVSEDVQEGACNLMVLRCAPLRNEEAMELARYLKRDGVVMVGDKSLVVDMKVKMEVEVDDNARDAETKGSLGFDLNQPYHHENENDDSCSYWN